MLVWNLIIKKKTLIIFIFYFEIKKTLTKAVNKFLRCGWEVLRHMLLKNKHNTQKKYCSLYLEVPNKILLH